MAAKWHAASPPKDTFAFAVLIAMIILAAALFGVGVSGIASGRVQSLLRAFGTNPELRTEVARHRRDIAEVSASLWPGVEFSASVASSAAVCVLRRHVSVPALAGTG